MSESNNGDGSNYGKSPHQPLQGLLDAAALAAHAPVQAISPDGKVLATSARGPQPVEGGGREVVVVDLILRDRLFGRLAAHTESPEAGRAVLEAFAPAAAFLLANAPEGKVAFRSPASGFGSEGHLDEQDGESQEVRTLVRMLRQLLAADYAAAATARPGGIEAWYALDGFNAAGTGAITRPSGNGHGELVRRSGQPVVLQDIGRSPDLPADEYPIHAAEGGVSALGVPLLNNGTPFGALILGSRASRNWTEADIAVSQLVAERVAAALLQTRSLNQERANRIFLENLVEHLPGTLVVLEPPDYRIVRANANVVRWLGESDDGSESIVGKTILELSQGIINDGQMESVVEILDRVLETGDAIAVEQFESNSSRLGTTYWNWVAAPITGTDDHPEPLVVMIAHEVTEAVQARQRERAALDLASRQAEDLRAHKAFLEKVIENFPGVLAVMGPPPNFAVVLANQQFVQLLAQPYASGQSIEGRALKDIARTWDERSDATLELMARVYESGEPLSFEEYESASPGQPTLYWNWMFVPVSPEQGDSGYIMLIAHDVTEMVLARQEAQGSADMARARAEELDAVINQMAEGVVIFGRNGQIHRLNPAGEKLLGRSGLDNNTPANRPEVFGLQMPSGEPVAELNLPSMRALNGETVVGEQLIAHRPDGEEIFIKVSVAPLTDAGGNITGAVGVFHDVTQETLIDRLKNEFVSIVSHELRTPLTAIMGYSDLMLRGVHGPLSERQGKALNAVRANANRLLHLINDLLDVSKLESGKVEINAEPVALAPIISRTIAQTRVLAAEAGVALHNYVPQRSLPMVLGDDAKLQQVIENLLTNAIKFTPAGGSVTFEATVASLPAGDAAIIERDVDADVALGVQPQSVVVSVRDTGAGLEEEQLERIWDRFYQVDATSRRRTGGAGLGLAIVRSIVELHGGLVWVESRGPGRGSDFHFSLPIASREALHEMEGLPKPKARPPMRTARKGESLGTVLVAEDDADQREIIFEMLELEGYEVVLANDGEEALELAAKIHPSAIILDVILPLADGWEVLHLLKKDPSTRDIPVLVISVVDQAGFGKKLGAEEYLLKPLDPQSLRKTVNRLVGVVRAPESEGDQASSAART